jgi:hypothetical protein
MSDRLLSLLVGGAWMALAGIGALGGLSLAAAAEGGRPIEFSDPKGSELSTNLYQLTNKKDSLKQLEDNLYQSLRPFAPKSAGDDDSLPLPTESAVPAIPSKRARELLERRNNYMFMTPEDLMKGPTAEEVLKLKEYGPDGQEKKKLTPLEQYYQRQEAKRAVAQKSKEASDDSFRDSSTTDHSRDFAAPRQEATLPESLRDTEQALKNLFGNAPAENATAQVPKRNPYSDIFGLGETTASPIDIQKHKKVLESLSSISDPVPQRPTPGVDGLNPLVSSLGLAPRTTQIIPSVLDLPAPKSHDVPAAQLGTINPIFSPAGPQDVNAQLLDQTSLSPIAPKTEAPRSSVPTPIFSSPRRPF